MVLLKKKKRDTEGMAHEDKRESVSSPSPVVEAIREGADSPPVEKRIRMSCDISKAQHRLLRIHAAETDQSIVEVVMGLIDMYCARK